MSDTPPDPEKLVNDLAARSVPEDVDRLDRQFSDKLEALAAEDRARPAMLGQLRALWRLVRAPDDEVPWKSKALAMAALSYFAAPFDAIPDFAGKAGYIDDAVVVAIVCRRLGDILRRFEQV